ncbi:MAG: hypothetical protein M3O46_14675 [Myxococcota bacterium]|nr:hypothetical protein [Myxococcota bacterium]
MRIVRPLSFGRVATMVVMALGRRSALAQAEEPTQEMPVAFGADQVRLDPHAQALEASGRVRVAQSPFYLTSDALRLRRIPMGVELEGKGTAAFCPCLGSPIGVRFHGATVAPPHDLILYDPVLEVFGLPVAWAPAIWLRSTGRFGVLPPDVTWRGADGLFVGGGVHAPWQNGDVGRGIDLRAGGYVDGGVAAQLSMRTAVTESRVAWDRWRGADGLSLRLRGATAIANGDHPDSAAWELGALRGKRAVKATTTVDDAAYPFDRADAQAAWRVPGWTFSSGVRSVALRGGDLLDLGAGGPVVAAQRADAIAHLGTYDSMVEAGAVSGGGAGMTSFARAEGGVVLATRFGRTGASFTARGVGVGADDGTRKALEGAAQMRASVRLPLERTFASSDEDDPWVHHTEPRIEVAAIATHAGDVLVFPTSRGMTVPSGRAWVAAGGWYNALGRRGSRSSGEIDASAGAVVDGRHALPVVRGRATASGRWFGLVGEIARVVAASPDGGGAMIARARLGAASTLYVSAHIAERDGVDPVVARSLVDAPLEPASGFLAVPGWTGGARIGLPLGSRITTRVGADVDLGPHQLVAALGALELHDPCNCVVLRANAAHRVGRDGIDVWLSVDLPQP